MAPQSTKEVIDYLTFRRKYEGKAEIAERQRLELFLD